MSNVKYLTVQTSKAPSRLTQPHSHWRDLMVSMKPGQWMFVKSDHHARVATAATTYIKGRYTFYKVPEGYCFKKIK